MKKNIQKTVKKARGKFCGYQKAALTFQDPEDIHQMRVAGRTLLTFFDILAGQQEKERPGFIKFKRPLKRVMSFLGEIRDLDVMMIEMEKRLLTIPSPEKDLLVEWLEERKKNKEKLQQEVKKQLPKWINSNWQKRVRKWQKQRLPFNLQDLSLEEQLQKLRIKKKEAIVALLRTPGLMPDPKDDHLLDQLHQIRIAVKKLRYALTYLASFLDKPWEEEVEQLKKLQEHLGDIQDLRVWIQQLADYPTEKKDEQEKILQNWQKELEEKLNQLNLTTF